MGYFVHVFSKPYIYVRARSSCTPITQILSITTYSELTGSRAFDRLRPIIEISLRAHNALSSPVASLTPHTHPQWCMESIHRMVMAPILVVAALKYSLKSTYCPAKPASVNTLDHIVSQRGYSGMRGLWHRPPMHPGCPSIQGWYRYLFLVFV